MKKLIAVLMVALLSVALIITPALAKGGGSGHSGGNSSSKSSNNSGSSEKVNKSNQNANSGKSKITKYGDAGEKQNLKNRLQKRMTTTTKKQFSDSNKHWADKYISLSQELGLVNGYEDGTFKPDDSVTTDEAVTMVVNLNDALEGTETTETETPESEESTTPETGEITETESETETETDADTPEWAQKYTKKAAALNIINLNRFHSQVQADRAQVAVMLAKALNLQPVVSTDTTFNDALLISSEDVGYILALKDAGIIQGSPDGKFNPNSSITRAEMATMMAKVVETTSGIEAPDTTTTDTTTDTTTTETTTTETPTTESPASETPTTEAPAPEAPAAETPAPEAPTTETPAL